MLGLRQSVWDPILKIKEIFAFQIYIKSHPGCISVYMEEFRLFCCTLWFVAYMALNFSISKERHKAEGGSWISLQAEQSANLMIDLIHADPKGTTTSWEQRHKHQIKGSSAILQHLATFPTELKTLVKNDLRWDILLRQNKIDTGLAVFFYHRLSVSFWSLVFVNDSIKESIPFTLAVPSTIILLCSLYA